MIFLFGVIFIRLGFVELSTAFFLELGAVLLITIQTRLWWWSNSEDKRLAEPDIKDVKKQYYVNVDHIVKDVNDFEEYTKILNIENRDNYVRNKMGSRKPENMKLNFIDKKILKRTQLEKYNALYFKLQRKADKLREIRASEITSLTETKTLYDSRNHLKSKKRTYHIGMSVVSFVLTTFLASMAFKELLLNWQNAARFLGYLFAIVWTIGMTIMTAYKVSGGETLDHIARLQVILDKYEAYKGGKKDGNIQNSDSNGLSEIIIRANATEPERTELV